ncbi:MAG: recombination mediator RecR [Candidatus Paceibacterota bacterium]
MDNKFEQLVEIFREFPGIGPRQARRFAYFVISKPSGFSDEISSLLKDVKKAISQCPICLKYTMGKNGGICEICSDDTRDKSIMVVAKDTDLQTVEKSGVFKGKYFVLGGLLSILEREPEKRIRINQLKDRIKKGIIDGSKEIILALNATSEGETTAEYLKETLKEFEINISELGRGISTGTEIEYLDKETLKGAIENKS